MSLEITGLVWRKSSFSNGGGMCVEVAQEDTQTVLVRDSKNVSHDNGGPPLRFGQTAFTELLANLQKA